MESSSDDESSEEGAGISISQQLRAETMEDGRVKFEKSLSFFLYLLSFFPLLYRRACLEGIDLDRMENADHFLKVRWSEDLFEEESAIIGICGNHSLLSVRSSAGGQIGV